MSLTAVLDYFERNGFRDEKRVEGTIIALIDSVRANLLLIDRKTRTREEAVKIIDKGNFHYRCAGTRKDFDLSNAKKWLDKYRKLSIAGCVGCRKYRKRIVDMNEIFEYCADEKKCEGDITDTMRDEEKSPALKKHYEKGCGNIQPKFVGLDVLVLYKG